MASLFTKEQLERVSEHTPIFVFSKQRLLENIKDFDTAFPGAHVQFAMKANSEPEVLKVFADTDIGFEVASVHELELLKDLKVKSNRIIFGTSVKPAESIRIFHEYGVDRYAFDSLPELEKIALCAPGSKVFVRVAVDDTGSVFKLSGKFGTEVDNIVPLLMRAKELGLTPYGISFHVGSQALNPEAWAAGIRHTASVFGELDAQGIRIEMLDIGGGHPHAYPSSEEASSLGEIARITNEALAELPYQPQLVLEPGRALVANAAVLITSVIERIERADGTWLFLDAGAYNALFEVMAYQGSIRYSITSLRDSFNAGEGMFILTGPTGDTIDVVSRETRLPLDMTVGDRLIVHDVGAYSLSLSSPFNGFPKPGILLIDD